ncbi:hypothetical protein ZEAMMB73_Zm00001d051680 [Zea mays]|uniref:Oxidoreductase FAD/NAD(P)-binding domain-containing protein n=1 Tax=Zea mays TaxID=4577 RepID=A0A1D6Q9B2_MAIZE|nr:hypothetical protein ZEAMMB73_Zm00001d051680 [Zea mays]
MLATGTGIAPFCLFLWNMLFEKHDHYKDSSWKLLGAVRETGLIFFRAPMEDKLQFTCDPARDAISEWYF